MIKAATIAAAFLILTACAHGKPDYCSREFEWGAMEWDLDDDGIAGGTDFAIYARECWKG